MFKYQRIFTQNEESEFAQPKTLGDWEECFVWYKQHGFLGKQKFSEWIPFLLTQSVKYVQEQWDFYCQNSMEELAFGYKFTKQELLMTI